jgi:hypothetical protein
MRNFRLLIVGIVFLVLAAGMFCLAYTLDVDHQTAWWTAAGSIVPATIGAVFLYLFTRQPSKCPGCGSFRTQTCPNDRKIIAPGHDEYQILYDRTCADCGTLWTPATPKWGGVLQVLAGLLIVSLAACVALDHDKLTNAKGFLSVACGVGLAFGALQSGINTLSGKDDMIKIHKKGTPTNAKPPQ